MTDQQPNLDTIEARWAPVPRGERPQISVTGSSSPGVLLAALGAAREDVEQLVAEVRCLRAELAEARRPRTPRLCECGHSHHAHTVPAPHSCFAYGQTCPCQAYRQLPHDKAVAQLKANQRAAEEREAARAAVESHVVADDSDDPEHCGAVHHHYPETVCTEPAGHYRRDVDPHAGPLIVDGRECGGAAWDHPAAPAARSAAV